MIPVSNIRVVGYSTMVSVLTSDPLGHFWRLGPKTSVKYRTSSHGVISAYETSVWATGIILFSRGHPRDEKIQDKKVRDEKGKEVASWWGKWEARGKGLLRKSLLCIESVELATYPPTL